MTTHKDNSAGLILLRILNGILIGGGAILPGVSGGVLAVVFGIYQPMMELLSHPFSAFKKHWKLFLPVGVGVGLGFVGFAKVVGDLFTRYETQMLCLFIGLILGTVPMLLKTARRDGPSTKKDYTALVISFAALLIILLLVNGAGRLSLQLNTLWAFISGIVWGFSLVVPGLSSSSLLIFMGLYDSIMTQVGALNLGIILPLFAGILLVALLFARFIDKLFNEQFSLASHAVVGLVLASTITIIPSFSGTGQLLMGILLAALGFIAAMQLDKWQAKMDNR